MASSATVSVTAVHTMQGGYRVVHGTATLSGTYITGGDTIDLSSYFKSASSPTVIPSSDDGYLIRHDRGTAAAGTLMAYVVNINASGNVALIEVANASNLSAVVVPFIAVGQAY